MDKQEQLTLIGKAEQIIDETPGDIIVVDDFAGLSSAAQVSRIFGAFVEEGKLFRLMFQVYVKGREIRPNYWVPTCTDIYKLAAQIHERLHLPDLSGPNARLSISDGHILVHVGKKCIFDRRYSLDAFCVPREKSFSRRKRLASPPRESRHKASLKEPLMLLSGHKGNIVSHNFFARHYGIRRAGQIFQRFVAIGAVSPFGHGVYLLNRRVGDEWRWEPNDTDFLDLVREALDLVGIVPKEIVKKGDHYVIHLADGRKSSRNFMRGRETAAIE